MLNLQSQIGDFHVGRVVMIWLGAALDGRRIEGAFRRNTQQDKK